MARTRQSVAQYAEDMRLLCEFIRAGDGRTAKEIEAFFGLSQTATYHKLEHAIEDGILSAVKVRRVSKSNTSYVCKVFQVNENATIPQHQEDGPIQRIVKTWAAAPVHHFAPLAALFGLPMEVA